MQLNHYNGIQKHQNYNQKNKNNTFHILAFKDIGYKKPYLHFLKSVSTKTSESLFITQTIMPPYLENANQSNYISSFLILRHCTSRAELAVHKIALKAGIVGCNRFVVILRYVGHVLKKAKG